MPRSGCARRACARSGTAPRRAPSDSRGVRLGRQLEVDLLERGTGDLEPVEPLPAGDGVAGEPVEQLRRVVGLMLHAARVGEVRHAIARAAWAELVRRALRDDPALLDDRD